MKTIICFDLDGVICSTKKNYYHLYIQSVCVVFLQALNIFLI